MTTAVRVTKKQEQADAIERLRKLLKPGDTVYTILKRVSSSGMTRGIEIVIRGADGIESISWLVARALDYRRYDDGSLKVSGCGMDMGFSVVSNLSYCLFPNGFECIGEGQARGERCPSNDHSNGDRDYTPHHHNSGDYALRQRWI